MTGIVAHEWIEPNGGAEKVLKEMLRALPDSELHALWSDVGPVFEEHVVHESALAKTFFRRRKAMALPLMPFVWRHLKSNISPEWILVSSHAFAHHATLPKLDVPKYVYAHSPARYLWEPDIDQRGQSLPARFLAPTLRRIDRNRAREAAEIAANSNFVRQRVQRTWNRDARVIYPPVDIERISGEANWESKLTDREQLLLKSLPRPFILGASRFVPYKRLDTVIKVAESLRLPVVLAGSGPDLTRLKSIAASASVPATFVHSPSDVLLYTLYQTAEAFVFPPTEDFGIMPVEAMAAGCRVVVSPIGGQAEPAEMSRLGVVAESADVKALTLATEHALQSKKPINSDERFSSLRSFSVQTFRYEIQTLVSAK